MKGKYLFLISYFVTINRGCGYCSTPTSLSLQLILEYASWRSWEQIVLFAEIDTSNFVKSVYVTSASEELPPLLEHEENERILCVRRSNAIDKLECLRYFDDACQLKYEDCALQYARPLITCLGEKGISLSIESLNNPKLPESLEIQRHRIGSVVLLDGLNLTSADNVLKVASNKRLFNYYVSWFLITNRPEDAIIDTTLRNLTIGINTDVVVGTAFHSGERAREITRSHSNRTCAALQFYESKSFISGVTDNLAERDVRDNITKNLDYSPLENGTMAFYLVHVYKIRIADNSSLVVVPLGSWNPGAYTLKLPVSTELRNNFNRLPIVVGILNGTNDDGPREGTDIEEKTAEIQPLHDFVDFLANSLNASMEMVPYEKLGTVTNKVWNNLLGDVYNGIVDIGLGYITINDERQRDMIFTHPLIRYTRNIYIRPPESGTMRDIFLQPFNNRMLLCVALMHFLIIVAIGTINYAAKNGAARNGDKRKSTGLGEATLWCISILCMQGSPWNPASISGKTALLASLVFALVTYNAYAGFITSILSVQATGIRTLEDVLRNNFKLGYSDADDEYMRNANDSDLRQLYIKAFNGRESRLDATLGLQKAVKGGYAFFVSATLARRALGTSLIQERCSIKEIEVRQTFTIVALPMEKDSPYAKIINLSVLRMKERGVIDRIREKMLPDMPQCQALTTFHSARIADVYSAFIILMIGVVTSLGLGLFERIWDQRRGVQERISRGLLGWGRFDKNLPWLHVGRKHFSDNVAKSSLPSSNDNSKEREEKCYSIFKNERIREKTRFIVDTKTETDRDNEKRIKHRIFPFQN